MVAIQTARRHRPLAAAQHSSHYFVVSSAPRDYRQSHVGPELVLAAKPVRRAYYCDQLRHAHGPELRHTHQPAISYLEPRFLNHLPFSFMSQRLQCCQLLIQEAGPLFRSWLTQFLQPLLPAILTIDIMTPASNRPTAKDSLKAIHHSRRVAHQAVVGAHQLF